MKKAHWVSTILVTVFLSALVYVMNNPIDAAYSQTVAQSGSDELPLPDRGLDSQNAVLSVNNFPGTHPVYFSPSDNTGTATVIIVYNTTAVTKTAYIQSVSSSGDLIVNATVPLAPYERKFLISDPLIASPPLSWQNNISTNFGDFSAVGILFVPDGVYFDGFILFNSGTGIIDPRVDQSAVPLHFSTDPLTVFLPITHTTP